MSRKSVSMLKKQGVQMDKPVNPSPKLKEGFDELKDKDDTLQFRFRGTAIPKGNKWGWEVEVIPPENGKLEKFILPSGDRIYNTRQEAVYGMRSEIPKMKGIIDNIAKEKFGAGASTMIDMKDGGKEINLEEYYKQGIKDGKNFLNKPLPDLTYEKAIKHIYSKQFWTDMDTVAKYDFKYRELRDFVLNEKPDPNIILLTGMDEGGYNVEDEDLEQEMELDLPFETCVFEATDATLFNLDSKDIKGGTTDVQFLYVTEFDNHYAFLVCDLGWNWMWAVNETTTIHKLLTLVTQKLCKFIHSKNVKLGQSKTNIRFKHKKTGVIKIKKIVHVTRTEKGEPVKISGRKFDVDWSHRWEVQGYYRRLPLGKVGKNRKGIYNKVGKTWVVSHTKGPEDKELVKKIRVVSDD